MNCASRSTNSYAAYRHSLQTDRRHLLEQFQFLQIARKVVGVGSVGTRAWILLLVGKDNGDPLILQAKEAEASVLEEFVGKSGYANHGARVVAGQHLMQASSDIFLGYEKVTAPDGKTRDFYLRQLRDWKGSFEIEGAIPQGLTKYVAVCGQALAGHTLVREIASPSPAIWAADPPSIGRWSSSRRPMQTRTSGTMRHSSRRQDRAHHSSVRPVELSAVALRRALHEVVQRQIESKNEATQHLVHHDGRGAVRTALRA